MIHTHSDDPDVEAAAAKAAALITQALDDLPQAETFDYGGHVLHLGEYGVCVRCTSPIAEAQQAQQKLLETAATVTDTTIKEHVELAAELFRLEAAAAAIRAELHNGQGSEPIINALLGFMYDRGVHDDYDHTHANGKRP